MIDFLGLHILLVSFLGMIILERSHPLYLSQQNGGSLLFYNKIMMFTYTEAVSLSSNMLSSWARNSLSNGAAPCPDSRYNKNILGIHLQINGATTFNDILHWFYLFGNMLFTITQQNISHITSIQYIWGPMTPYTPPLWCHGASSGSHNHSRHYWEVPWEAACPFRAGLL